MRVRPTVYKYFTVASARCAPIGITLAELAAYNLNLSKFLSARTKNYVAKFGDSLYLPSAYSLIQLVRLRACSAECRRGNQQYYTRIGFGNHRRLRAVSGHARA